tara:strand:+ start:516 stop:1895 length:1380 start_codon:yes stop_codon:yes gene_type:complete
MPKFPYGKVPFWILLIAISTGIFNLVVALSKRGEKPDLVFVSFARSHMEAYEEATEEFQKEHGVKVQLQLVSTRTVNSRLQNAFLTNANVPDVVEILADTMGTFTKGPIEDVGFVDLTDRLHAEGLYDRFVESRYSRLSRLGRIFALPHDVHPLMLCYRSDLVEKLGIDVHTLRTWDDFVEMGRRITRDLDGDGNPDRYALDLPANGDMLTPLLLQRREPLFTKNGQLKINNHTVEDTIIWYIHQSRGKNRIAFSAGWGQTLAQTVTDGLVLFYFCPDWRTKYFETDTPHLSGKMKLMPLPAWEIGGSRVSTWGGTGLAITKACKNQKLAWKFAKVLYLKAEDLGKRFKASYIIPPVKDAWDLPEFKEPVPFYTNQPIGALYAEMAKDVPSNYASPYYGLARNKLNEVFINAALYYDRNGDDGLKEYIKRELARVSAYVENRAQHNIFYRQQIANKYDE